MNNDQSVLRKRDCRKYQIQSPVGWSALLVSLLPRVLIASRSRRPGTLTGALNEGSMLNSPCSVLPGMGALKDPGDAVPTPESLDLAR